MAVSLWSQAAEPVNASTLGNGGTNGVHFTVSTAATLNGIWHYSPSGYGQTQLPTSIALYTWVSSGSGTLIHSETVSSWSGAAGSGWVYAAFASPPSLSAATDYIAVQFRNDVSNAWFIYTQPVTFPVSNSILTAPQDVGAGQGWYNSGTTLTYPSTQLAGYFWWVDVSVTAAGGGPAPVMYGFL